MSREYKPYKSPFDLNAAINHGLAKATHPPDIQISTLK